MRISDWSSDVCSSDLVSEMSIVRYSPFGANPQFQDEIKQVFDRFFGESDGDQSNVVTSQWAPRVDIREEDKRFVILADIPGVDPADIEVQMDKGKIGRASCRERVCQYV